MQVGGECDFRAELVVGAEQPGRRAGKVAQLTRFPVIKPGQCIFQFPGPPPESIRPFDQCRA